MKAKMKVLFEDNNYHRLKPFTHCITLRRWLTHDDCDYILESTYTTNEESDKETFFSKETIYKEASNKILLDASSDSKAIQLAVKKLNEIKQIIEELKNNEQID